MVSGNEISSNLASTMDTTYILACLCPECGISFTEMWMMKEHKRVAHDERVLQCETCNVEVVGSKNINFIVSKKLEKEQVVNLMAHQ